MTSAWSLPAHRRPLCSEATATTPLSSSAFTTNLTMFPSHLTSPFYLDSLPIRRYNQPAQLKFSMDWFALATNCPKIVAKPAVILSLVWFAAGFGEISCFTLVVSVALGSRQMWRSLSLVVDSSCAAAEAIGYGGLAAAAPIWSLWRGAAGWWCQGRTGFGLRGCRAQSDQEANGWSPFGKFEHYMARKLAHYWFKYGLTFC